LFYFASFFLGVHLFFNILVVIFLTPELAGQMAREEFLPLAFGLHTWIIRSHGRMGANIETRYCGFASEACGALFKRSLFTRRNGVFVTLRANYLSEHTPLEGWDPGVGKWEGVSCLFFVLLDVIGLWTLLLGGNSGLGIAQVMLLEIPWGFVPDGMRVILWLLIFGLWRDGFDCMG
jgi:hypothetical protein